MRGARPVARPVAGRSQRDHLQATPTLHQSGLSARATEGGRDLSCVHEGRPVRSKGYPARRRRRLWEEQDGLCYYCKCPTKLPEVIEGAERGIRVPDMATLDHVYPRGTAMRARGSRDRIVLACWECNNRRGREHSRRVDEHRAGLR